MSLIRCLGPVSLPLRYRQFMRTEADEFKVIRNRRQNSALFTQERIFDPSDKITQNSPSKSYAGSSLGLTDKPIICPILCRRLSSILSGKQVHTVMTMVFMDMHDDDLMGERATALIIPYQVSDHHHLQVEGETRRLLAGHIYAFNQSRQHGLLYEGHHGPKMSSTPCSLINVSFIAPTRKLR